MASGRAGAAVAVRLLLIIAALVVVAGCGGRTLDDRGAHSPAARSDSRAPHGGAVGGTSAGVTASSAGGKVTIVGQQAIAWQSEFGMVDVIVEIRNEGTRTAQINGGAYTMYSKSGDELDTGYFLYAFPRMLGPGQTGYIAERDHSESWSAADVGTVEATFDYDWLDGSKGTVLTTAGVRHEKDEYGSGGYVSGGTVTNRSETFVPMAHIGVFYLAADGTPLGFTYTDLVENLAPGQTKDFKTYGESPPLRSWDRTVVIAVAD